MSGCASALSDSSMIAIRDPVALGLVSSLARPGGNEGAHASEWYFGKSRRDGLRNAYSEPQQRRHRNRLLMSKQHWKLRSRNDMARCTPKNHLPKAALRVRTFDQEIGAKCACFRENCLAGPLITRRD